MCTPADHMGNFEARIIWIIINLNSFIHGIVSSILKYVRSKTMWRHILPVGGQHWFERHTKTLWLPRTSSHDGELFKMDYVHIYSFDFGMYFLPGLML